LYSVEAKNSLCSFPMAILTVHFFGVFGFCVYHVLYLAPMESNIYLHTLIDITVALTEKLVLVTVFVGQCSTILTPTALLLQLVIL